MIRFEHVKTYNWLDALRGMRNSWESWSKMDSLEYYDKDREKMVFEMGAQDLALALRLVKAGSDHAKYLRQIMVSVDIIAPEYWWKEADTYKVGTVANSTSMMHTLGRTPFDESMFSMEDMSEEQKAALLDMLNTFRDAWIESGKKKPSTTWRAMNQAIPISFNYRRTFTCNYAVLRAMYHSRKNHRLSEWEDFRQWCETLPHSELITYVKEKKEA